MSQADGKLDYVFITPTVDRLMLSNKVNKLIKTTEHASLLSECALQDVQQTISHGVHSV